MNYRAEGQLTVAELIELLKEQPQDLLVEMQGWDSWEPAGNVRRTQLGEQVILIERLKT